jgi:plastocyanin
MSPKNWLRSPLRLAVVVLAIVGLALVLAACGSSSGSKSSGSKSSGSNSSGTSSDPTAKSTSPTSAAAASGDTVNIKLIAYKPAKVTVTAGTTVSWKQMDPGVHTVTSGTVTQDGGTATIHPDGAFDSGEIATGKSFDQKFDTPGTHMYFCRIHPATMQAEVTVK